MAAETGDRIAEILFFALMRRPVTGMSQDHFETTFLAAAIVGSSPAAATFARMPGGALSGTVSPVRTVTGRVGTSSAPTPAERTWVGASWGTRPGGQAQKTRTLGNPCVRAVSRMFQPR